jgi:hypothetical protein
MELLFKDAHNVVSKKNDRINNVNPEMIILRHSDVFLDMSIKDIYLKTII